jgi:succinate dehydrogenase/fumarate reductase flavoprotein subunit
MLGGSQVFGWRAGETAAEVAKHHSGRRAAPSTIERSTHARLARFGANGGSHDIREMKRVLQRTMWKKLLVEKDAKTLAEVRDFIAEERERLRDVRRTSPFDVVLMVEHENMLDVASVITEAADFRTESRGAHYRSDHPERNDEAWMTNVFVTWSAEGKPVLEKKWINQEVGWEEDPAGVRITPWG